MVGHQRKTKGFVQNTELLRFSCCYWLVTFANELVLTLKADEQHAELNSQSNSVIFRVGHQRKTKGFVQTTGC